MAAGRLEAAKDLLGRLRAALPEVPIYALTPTQDQAQALAGAGAQVIRSSEAGFHFGKALDRMCQVAGTDAVLYFGGASAPLLSAGALRQLAERLKRARGPLVITNNLHSSDWALIKPASPLAELAQGLPNDNALAWALHHEAGFEVYTPPRRASTAMDLDTPADLLLCIDHPDLGPHLRAYLDRLPEGLAWRVKGLRQVLGGEGRSLAVIGRSSALVWRALERATRIWVRMYVEERGMLASGRLGAGQVWSLVGEALESWGPEAFIARLEAKVDAVLWDTRVWMAHRGGWPRAADRFAADLGWVEEISDASLRALTEAVVGANIPILTGGHGVVSGGILALLETQFGEKVTNPE
jgi:CTP:molybdopterin cytidylyltransferase MocA